MPKILKLLCLFGVIFTMNTGFSQFKIGYGYELSFLNAPKNEPFSLYAPNENETIDRYQTQPKLNPLAHGLVFRHTGGQFMHPNKWHLGYSMEVGLHRFSSEGKLVYMESSTNNPDSIVNAYDGVRFKTFYNTVNLTQFFDVHWNPSQGIKITNSLGVGLSAIVLHKTPNQPFSGSIVDSNFPLLRLNYQIQLTEKHERISTTYFMSVDLLRLRLFQLNTFYTHGSELRFDQVRFGTIGIRFSPHYKAKVEIPMEPDPIPEIQPIVE